MTLPNDFDPFEHLQQTYKTEFNRRVDRYFSDVQGNGDLSGPRPSLKLACRILDNDNDAMMNMRHNLFFNVIGYSRKNLAVVYGSKFDTAPPVAGHPQLFFVFSQDAAATPSEESPIQHEKSVRLMKFSCASGDDDNSTKPAITKANMTEIANEIKNNFLSGGRGITYTCGNKTASYTDPENGFPRGNYILVNSKADGVEIYQKICNVIDVPFHSDRVLLNDPDKPSTTTATAGKVTILGKQVQNRRYRPVAVLRFRSAYISLGNLVPPVFLIDTTLRNQSLVRYP
ncbi:hypothetical protein ACE1AT_13915 [Pelatocladus sp. BLCC-F211]|uniref:hypothetical protein n=1 Tax=Pelatocladus sp. BLCC-F211 TaxID=3342752 RepID=UPI000B5DF414|nr:hypothetical protein NIES4106_10210 [Fischerella sp. NIES-4106]BAZ70555.1 hypothetical protein NIES4106_53500 [Fischerella sp. NIES-4106]